MRQVIATWADIQEWRILRALVVQGKADRAMKARLLILEEIIGSSNTAEEIDQ